MRFVGGPKPGTVLARISVKFLVKRVCSSICSRLITVTERGTSSNASSVRVAVTTISIGSSSPAVVSFGCVSLLAQLVVASVELAVVAAAASQLAH